MLMQALQEYDIDCFARTDTEVSIRCPACNAPAAKRGQPPACEVNIRNATWHCFRGVCGKGGKCYLTTDGLVFWANGQKILVVDSSYSTSVTQAMTRLISTNKNHKPTITSDNTHEWIDNPSNAIVCIDHDAWQAYEPAIKEYTLKHFIAGTAKPFAGQREPMLIYTVKNPKGTPIGFRYRYNKWKSLAGLKNTLFNADDIKPNSIVIIGESPVAAMLGWQYYAALADGTPITFVAPTNGATSWRDEWSTALWRIGVEGVIVAYDNDKAGKTQSDKLVTNLEANGLRVNNYKWGRAPQGYDLRDLLSSDITNNCYSFGHYLADTHEQWVQSAKQRTLL